MAFKPSYVRRKSCLPIYILCVKLSKFLETTYLTNLLNFIIYLFIYWNHTQWYSTCREHKKYNGLENKQQNI